MRTTTNPPGPATILIVDDDTDQLKIMRLSLEHAGYRTLTAPGGREALECVRSESVDVILLDVMMPGMGGLQVCEELKRIDRTMPIPVILVTAKDDTDTRAAGMRLGVSDFLTKPVNMQELHIRVQNQLHVREIRRQLDETSRRIDTLTRGDGAE
jgi:DNA-binding response OmpR family regulator